jgi:hypothetical protein
VPASDILDGVVLSCSAPAQEEQAHRYNDSPAHLLSL